MLVTLHDFDLTLDSDSARIEAEWAQLYAPFSAHPGQGEGHGGIPIRLNLTLASAIPPPPAGQPAYAQSDLAVYPAGDHFVIHLPQLGQLQVDPAAGAVDGILVLDALDLYGAFENINAIGLAPLLRRHGRVLIHAFAVAFQGEGLLLVGDSASGKTTTGLALLAAGWKLVANDSPMLGKRDGQVTAYAYPGLISAHADALRRIPALRALVDDPALAPPRPDWKISLAAEDHFASPWQERAPVKAICLLRLDPDAAHSEHRLKALSPAATLGRLLPHSVDRWDQEAVGSHIDLLQALAEQAPACRLALGTDVAALPRLLESLVGGA